MKASKYIFIAAIAAALTACNYSTPNPDTLYLSEAQVTEQIADGQIYHINDFLDAFMSEEGNYLSDTSLYRTRSTNGNGIYLFSLDTIPSTGPGIYLRGRVSTDDFGGNFYKALVIQEIVDGKQQNLRLSVDLGSASGMFPRGQEILIRCNGLAVGRYANQPQLCVPSYNNNTNAQKADQKIGWAPGRIPAPICKKRFMLVGKPDESKLQYDEVTIAECIANFTDIVGARKIDGRLVKLNNIWFNGKCLSQQKEPIDCVHYDPATNAGNPEVADSNADVFAPTTNNVGFPQSRCITDGTKWTLVSTSEYAKYAHYYLPAATYKGSVRGVLGFYMDNASYDPGQDAWAITICDLSDLDLKADDGTPWEPEEWQKSQE
ncbi:MAG: hypothetical protein J5688_02045 [Paludibacteraceae bacterium]|nr:hypothetical protein [Paludibacteraceae bacterium]